MFDLLFNWVHFKASYSFLKTLLSLVFGAFLFAQIFVTPLSAQAQSPLVSLSEEEKQWIAAHPVLTVTNNMDLVPLDFVNNGRSMGFAIDYLNLVAENVGLTLSYQNNKSWNELVEQVKRQEIDITHSLMSTPEREGFLNFTEPYLEIPIVNFGRTGAPRINSIDDLKNKKIGVIEGWAITDHYHESHPEFELVEYTAIKDALFGISSGEVDVVTGSQFTLEYFISQNFLNNVEVIGDDYAFRPHTDIEAIGDERASLKRNIVEHRLATRKDYPILRDILQKGMDAITAEQHSEFLDKWRMNYKPSAEINFTDDEKKWLSEHSTIKVTNKMGMAPIDFVQGGVATGFSIDYLDLIAEKIGIKIEYVNGISWNESLERVKNKQIDVTHSLVKTAERDEYLDYTKPYLHVPWVYFGRTGTDRINSLSDLEDKKIGLVKGSFPWRVYQKDYPHLGLVEYDSSNKALNALSTGEIDVYINLLTTTNYNIKRNLITNVEVTGRKFYPEALSQGEFRLAVRDDWPALKSILEKGMDAITEEEFATLADKWQTQISNNIIAGLSPEEQSWLSENNKVRVALNRNDTAPFQFINEAGELSGISGEILNKIGDVLDIEFEFIETSNWDEALVQITNGNSHIIPAIIPTESRKQDLLFSDAYYSEHNVIFARNENTNFRSLDNLNGHKIAQILGDARVSYIRENYPEIEIIEAETAAKALQMVSDQSADAYIGLLSRTLYYLNKEKIADIGVVGDTPLTTELSLGISNNYPLLASSINKALKAIPEDEKRRIIDKWMAVQVVAEIDYAFIFKIVLAVSLILGAIIYWNNKLRREVARRIEVEKSFKEEQEKTLNALKENELQLTELQFQRETIEQSAVAQAELMDDLGVMADKIQSKNDLLTEIMNNTGHGIVVFSHELKLQTCNDTFKDIMEIEDCEYEENMDMKSFFELNMKNNDEYELSIDDYISELKDRIKNRKTRNEFSWDREKPNGVIINTVQRIMGDGTVINTYKDVTTERLEERRIHEMALTDGLTNLANRRAFDVNIEQSIQNYKKSGTPFMLAYMDLDNFKALNDTQGHKAGDLVLVNVANIIKKYIRGDDVPARLGGDEFAIIFQNSDDIEATAHRLEMIIQEIKNTRILEGYDINVGASAGLALCSDASVNADELVEMADKALYIAKENGKGYVHKSVSA